MARLTITIGSAAWLRSMERVRAKRVNKTAPKRYTATSGRRDTDWTKQ